MSPTGSHQDDGGNKGEQKIIKIDPDGDLTLVVGETKTRFLVCSKTLSRSAPFWKRCLYGPFNEGKPADGKDWVVKLPEDNPSGLKCLLLLVHGLGHKMPEIDLRLAFQITVLTNKYDMTRYLWALSERWLHDLGPPAPYFAEADATVVPQLWWLWVTKEIGAYSKHALTFAELCHMVSTTANGNGDLNLRLREQGDADALTPETLGGYEAERDIILGLADDIKAAREKALSDIQHVLKMDIKNLRDAVINFDLSEGCPGALICKSRSPRSQRLCEYAMQAIVTKMSSGKNSVVKPLAKVYVSVEEFLLKAKVFKRTIEDEIRTLSDLEHSECTPFRTTLPFLHTMEKRTFRRWTTESIRDAFKRQAQASGLEKGGVDDEDQEPEGWRSAARKRSRDESEDLTLG